MIVDDEKYGRENLALLLESRFPEIDLVARAENLQEARQYLDELHPDIVFLDIRLEDELGFDLLEGLDHKDFATIVVSGYADYGITAVKFGVADYVLKPINSDDIAVALNRAKEHLARMRQSKTTLAPPKTDRLKLATFQGFFLIQVADILRLESDSNYTTVYMVNGEKHVVSRTMKEFEPFLDEAMFFRIHRSHIINTAFIKGYTNKDGGYVVLSDDTHVEISRSRIREFMDFVNQRFGSLS